MLARIVAVIEHKTQLDLARVPTGLSFEMKASVRLWFLPGMMSWFDNSALLRGNVKGNRYETTKILGSSYE
jgi:hypothetical protein